MRIDNHLDHLYPDFRVKLEKVLEEVGQATGHKWVLVEGYRSKERQLEIYAQGRTKPGPIVTWKKTPTWHGTGLAADVAPISANNGQVTYQCPRWFWETLRKIGQKHGLINPAWSKGDLGHLQDGDTKLLVKAQAFINRGFK